jgi:hypothetical protein
MLPTTYKLHNVTTENTTIETVPLHNPRSVDSEWDNDHKNLKSHIKILFKLKRLYSLEWDIVDCKYIKTWKEMIMGYSRIHWRL